MATLDHSLDRGLPASPDAERSILGGILLDNFLQNEAAATLQAEHFFLDSHRRIYQRMLDLNEFGKPIDIISLADELGRHKELESVGGVAYLTSLTDGVPRRQSIEHYIRLVKDKALLRGLIHAANGMITKALDQEDETAEVLDAAEASLFALTEARIGQDLMALKDIVKESFPGGLDTLYEAGRRITGVETHYVDLDELTSGLQPSDLVIVAARPSMGKTALAINMAENVSIIGGQPVAIFSLEMSREALLRRMLCSQSRVDSHKFRTGFLGKEDLTKIRNGLDALLQAPLYIDDTPGISLTELRAKARRLKHTTGLGMIVVDYLQLMSATAPGGKRYENRTQEVSAISRGLKAIAKELKVPMVALSQLSRAPETRGTKDNEPKLSDLRESGSIEQDADVVMFIYRPEYYNRDDPTVENKAKIIISKQRNGPTDTIQLAYIKQWTRFENLDRSEWL
ncbi:MAG TPA: replicative DNA helicase [Terriglobales bacterium]|nr:replicative DNA helicase [Terriglobales bacterium]